MSSFLLKRNIEDEIGKYNRLLLNKTVEAYEDQLKTVKGLLFNLFYDSKVTKISRQFLTNADSQVDYLTINEIRDQIGSLVSNSDYYMDNLIIHFKEPSLVLDKSGVSQADRMYALYYKSELYPAAFWKEQFAQTDNFEIYESDTFALFPGNQHKQLIPVSVRNRLSSYQITAFLDAEAMFASNEAFSDSDLLIYDDNGEMIYSSSEPYKQSMARIPPSMHGQETIRNGNYYFYEQGADSGLTFVTITPLTSMTSQINRLNATMLALLLLSILIGIVASLFFSRRLQHPVQQIIASILQRKPVDLKGKINEFQLIHEKVHHLMQEKADIQNDLLSQKSLLTHYGFIARLKKINADLNDMEDFIFADKAFRIVLFQLHFRNPTQTPIRMNADKAVLYIREYIDLILSEKFSGSHTLQIEKHQLLTILFPEEQQDDLEETLYLLKHVFDRDRLYCLVTVAVSSTFRHSNEFNAAYEQALEMVQQAKLIDETQLIMEHRPILSGYLFPAEKEQEFYANMQAGNDAICIELIWRMLDQLHAKDESAQQFKQFTNGVIQKILRILEVYKIETDGHEQLQDLLRKVDECYTVDQLKGFFRQFISLSASLIKAIKAGQNQIAGYVVEYLEAHYAEDISLDSVADKFNLSSAYLSVHIKEKTGINFSEHLNRIRMAKAKELLELSPLNIQEIGMQIGYHNLTSFIRMFKKLTGYTPGDYRKRKNIEQLEERSL